MKQLVVLAYVDEFRAVEVLALLQRRHLGPRLPLHAAVGVIRNTDWHVTLLVGTDLAEDGDPAAPFWRGLVASLVLAPGTEACRRRCEDYGIEARFEHEIRQAMPPGSSAVFVLMPEAVLPGMRDELCRLGGTLLQTPIAPDLVPDAESRRRSVRS